MFERHKKVTMQFLYQIYNMVERSLMSVWYLNLLKEVDSDERCKVELSVLSLREGRGLRLYLF